MSATVGNPESLIDWLAGSCKAARKVFAPSDGSVAQAEVKLDYVGSLQNAAVVISRLHRGEKRLVFIDSRAGAEQLGAELRSRDVTTFVTHSSLSHEQRTQAKDAFANRDDCVIVATSVLELGLDVGNLDRVIQIDSPATVTSFLQRMGRTGRREGAVRNCLFLATRDETLVRAAGLVELWIEGYIEPIQPPPEPYHVLAQQLMALILQEGGIGRRTWVEWIRNVPAFASMPPERIEEVVKWMLEHGFLWEDQGILGMGPSGENAYGRKHFLELLSVFSSPPLFEVFHGRQDLGFVDDLTFLGKQDGPRVILLGGRAWRVTHVDWRRRAAYVEASEDKGRSRWKGEGRGLAFRLCQAVKRILVDSETRSCCSRRAGERLAEIRSGFSWLTPEGSVILTKTGTETEWWTFAGAGANATLASALSAATTSHVAHDSLSLTLDGGISLQGIDRAMQDTRSRHPEELLPAVDESALEALKFSESLPRKLAIHALQMRIRDETAVRTILAEPVRFVS